MESVNVDPRTEVAIGATSLEALEFGVEDDLMYLMVARGN